MDFFCGLLIFKQTCYPITLYDLIGNLKVTFIGIERLRRLRTGLTIT